MRVFENPMNILSTFCLKAAYNNKYKYDLSE